MRHTVGMTGEVTLQGRVLPIGGLKQKVLAAHAAGLTDVILPERNRADLEDVPEDVREQMKFHPVMTIDEVLALALEPAARIQGGGGLTASPDVSRYLERIGYAGALEPSAGGARQTCSGRTCWRCRSRT